MGSSESLAGIYVPVMIDGFSYGIPNGRVRAIATMQELLVRDRLPEFIAGVITRCGRLIPVFDLHRTASRHSAPPLGGAIMVVQARPEGFPAIPVGLCVDHIGEPVRIEAGDIENRKRPRQSGLPSLARVRNRVGALLDFDGIVRRSLFAGGDSAAA